MLKYEEAQPFYFKIDNKKCLLTDKSFLKDHVRLHGAMAAENSALHHRNKLYFNIYIYK